LELDLRISQANEPTVINEVDKKNDGKHFIFYSQIYIINRYEIDDVDYKSAYLDQFKKIIYLRLI